MLDAKTVIGSVRGRTGRKNGAIPEDPMEGQIGRSSTTVKRVAAVTTIANLAC